MQSYSSLETSAHNLVSSIDTFASDHATLAESLDCVAPDAKTLLLDHQRYQAAMRDLVTKKEVLQALHSHLTFTDQEKKVLLSTDEDDFEHARVGREK